MSVDRPARDRFAHVLRQFRHGHITNRDLLDVMAEHTSQDAAVVELERVLCFDLDDSLTIFRLPSHSGTCSSVSRTFREKVMRFLYEDRCAIRSASPADLATLDRCIRFLETDYEYVRCTKTTKQRLVICWNKTIHLATLGHCGKGVVDAEAASETWPFSESQKDAGCRR